MDSNSMAVSRFIPWREERQVKIVDEQVYKALEI
jgi:hypothetical protein